ncbi:MAG: hypothetical protein QM667_03860 [Asticcacaulis sp.]
MSETISDLLTPEAHKRLEAQITRTAEKDRALRRFLNGAPLAKGIVTAALDTALRADPFALLAEGWRTSKDIRKFHAGERAQLGEPVVLKLGAHDIERDLMPEVVVNVGAERRFPLKLALTLSGGFEGVELSILDGDLTAIGSGHCRLSLKVRVAGRTVESITLGKLSLPGEHRLTPALPLYS